MTCIEIPSKACLFQNDDIINFVPIQNNPLINEVSSQLGIVIRPISTNLRDLDQNEDVGNAIEPVRSENPELTRWLMLNTNNVQVDQGRFSKETRNWTKIELTPIQQAENLLNFVRRDLTKIQKLKSSIIPDGKSQTGGHGLTAIEKWAAIELVNTQHQIHQGMVSKVEDNAFSLDDQ